MRALYGTDGTQNATHGSDSAASAAREIAFFFPELQPDALEGPEATAAYLQVCLPQQVAFSQPLQAGCMVHPHDLLHVRALAVVSRAFLVADYRHGNACKFFCGTVHMASLCCSCSLKGWRMRYCHLGCFESVFPIWPFVASFCQRRQPAFSQEL